MEARKPQSVSNLKVALERERVRLRASLVRLSQAEQDFALSEHQESGAGGSQGDVASDMTEQTLEVSLEMSERAQLTEVEAALKRLARRRYGICEKCQQEIDPARLLAIPWTRFCFTCASS